MPLDSRSFVATFLGGSHPVPQWWLHGNGHVISGALVICDHSAIEAQILFDDVVLYRSRHSSRALAEEELAALRNRCTNEGWLDSH